MPSKCRKVWNALKCIPHGTVVTYSELAKKIGHPTSARAVANACAKNPYAPKVPCHRVIRSDGSLGGYALGINKKIQLLNKEGIIIKNNQVVDYKNKLYRFPK